LHALAHYDNSRSNPANPNPDATVREGEQTTDEMFRGHFEVARADEDLTAPPTLRKTLARAPLLLVGVALLGLVTVVVFRRWLSRAGRAAGRGQFQQPDAGVSS